MVNNLDGFANSCRVKGLIAVLGLASFAWVPSAHAAKLIWTGDLETGDTSQFKRNIYDEGTYGFVDTVTAPEPVRAGKYAARAVAKGPLRKRAELLSHLPGEGKMKFLWDGPEYWIGFSIFFKEWKANGNTFAQIHAPNEPKGDECDFAGNTFSVVPAGTAGNDSNGFSIEDKMQVRVLDNPTGISSGKGSSSNNITAWQTPIVTGVWNDYVVRFKLSTKGDGYYEVWHNGKKIYSRFNMYNVNWKDSCGNLIPADRRQHNGVHIGIYSNSDDQYQSMYFDEVRIAEGTNGYDLVDPSGSGSGTVVITPPPAPTGLVIQTN